MNVKGQPRRDGRKRVTFCESCKINPIPIKQCRPCKNIYEREWDKLNPEKIKAQRKRFYWKHKEAQQLKKRKFYLENRERILKMELDRKDLKRYGEFASAHRMFIKLRKLIRKNEI